MLLVADPPAEHGSPGTEGPAGRHEAIVALARAVFAAGGRIAVPADPGIALVLATVGLEYAAARPAERWGEEPPPPVMVVETGPRTSGRGTSWPLSSPAEWWSTGPVTELC